MGSADVGCASFPWCFAGAHALVVKVASSVLTPLLPRAQRGWSDVGGSCIEALVPKVAFEGLE